MKIGVQFFTLREQCQTLEDLSLALKKVADIGYTTVQLSGVCKYEPYWIKNELDKNGLKCVLTHTSPDELKENPIQAVNNHNIFDCKCIGLGSMPGGVNEENLEKFIKDYKNIAKVIYENGSKLFYHHHHWEFSKCKDGEKILDKILKAFPSEHLGITFDTFWAQYGGNDVVSLIDSLHGRLKCVHLKDMEIVGDEQRMAPVGHGNMDFEKIVSHLENAKAEYLLVEQDNCYGKDPFECLKQSYNYLKSLGLN